QGGRGRQVEQQRQQRRQQGEGRAGGQPMRQHLGQRGQFQRQRRQGDQVQTAIFEIALEQPVQRQQRRQHSAHPQDAAAHPRQQAQVRAHAQRHQGRHQGKE